MRLESSDLERRTAIFFDQHYESLAQSLENKIVALVGTDKKILLTQLVPYSHQTISEGWRYRQLLTMQPGDVWFYRNEFRKMSQALVVAKDFGVVGACVRVERASFSVANEPFSPMPREGDIANFLEAQDNRIGRLRFLDQSDILYLTV